MFQLRFLMGAKSVVNCNTEYPFGGGFVYIINVDRFSISTFRLRSVCFGDFFPRPVARAKASLRRCPSTSSHSTIAYHLGTEVVVQPRAATRLLSLTELRSMGCRSESPSQCILIETGRGGRLTQGLCPTKIARLHYREQHRLKHGHRSLHGEDKAPPIQAGMPIQRP